MVGRPNKTGINWGSKDPGERARFNLHYRNWKLRNPGRTKELNRKSKLKVKYNLTLEAYETLVKNQKSCCAICNKEAALNIDHNHETGKVRGLLCRECNLAIGMLQDKEALCVKAADYLRRNK